MKGRYEFISPVDEPEGRSLLKPLFFMLSLAIFIVGGFYLGSWALAYNITGMDTFPSPALPSLPGFLRPARVDGDDQVVDYANKDRVNILVLGVDRRPGESTELDLVRTDTMMVVSLDPKSKTAGLLSIPRDLWVPIPLTGNSVVYDRINAANVYGELYEYDGGGTALAMRTVEYNIGVKIHHYVKVDFEGFSKIVDSLGGVTVTLERPLIDHEYPTPDYGTMSIYIPAGAQQLDGEKALWYARSRHMDSDLSRIKRQQQVLLAIRDKVLQLNIVIRLPKLWTDFRSTVDTDLSLPDIIGLGMVVKEVKKDSISSYALDGSTVRGVTTVDGASILVPVRDEIKKVVDRYLSDDPLVKENAKVLILNGTTKAGLATKTAQRLKNLGFDDDDIEIGDTGVDGISATTNIYDLSGKKYSIGLLADALKVPQSRIVIIGKDNSHPEDIRIVLGEDAPFD